MSTCRCENAERLEGADVPPYVEHLRLVTVDNATWLADYICPLTGARWQESFPRSHLHGGGPPVLIRLQAPAR